MPAQRCNGFNHFLSSARKFSEKLWTKKKFVIQSDYCLTLDLVPAKFYKSILNNEKQINEWRGIYSIQSESVNIDFLHENKFLVIDTSNFDDEFKRNLLNSLEKIDDLCNGLLLHTDNYHGLNLIQKNSIIK